MGLIKKYIYQKALSFMMYYHSFIEILEELLGNTESKPPYNFDVTSHSWTAAKKIFPLPKLEMIHL